MYLPLVNKTEELVTSVMEKAKVLNKIFRLNF